MLKQHLVNKKSNLKKHEQKQLWQNLELDSEQNNEGIIYCHPTPLLRALKIVFPQTRENPDKV